MTIEVQQVPKPEEVTRDIHTTQLHIQKEPQVDTPFDMTEETRFKESIELDHQGPRVQQPQSVTVVTQPTVTHPVSMVTQKGTMVMTEPTTQFEIQIGFPQQQQPRPTSTVTTETTTFTTTTTTQEVVDVESYPNIVEGGEFHKTSMVVTSQEEPQPLKLIEIQKLPTEDVLSETTSIITKEMRTITQEPEVSESEERHSETIEIQHDKPQEVQFEISLPDQQTITKTEKKLTTQTQQERRTSVQKYEVEIQEKFMVQKPHEIHIPFKGKSEVEFDIVDGAEPKDLPCPTEEKIEVIRPTLEVEKKPEPIVEEEIPREEKTKQEVHVEFPVEETPTEESPVQKTPVEESPVEETPVEETPVEETPVEETPVEETPVEETPVEETPVEEIPVEETPVEETPVEETPVEETPVEEMPVMDISVETTLETTAISEETKQEVQTFVIETEVQKTDIIDSQETHLEEITFDLKGRPKEEVTFSIDIQGDKPVEDVPVKEVKEETHHEEITFQLVDQPQDIEETTPKQVEALEESAPEEQVSEVETDAPAQPVIMTERETIQVTQLEAETPAPLQPVEVTQRAVIEHIKEPESETGAPEDILEISQRETIEIIREPEAPEEVIQIDINISEQLPEVTTTTETEESRITKEVTFEIPQGEESYQEEMVINVKNEPMEEVHFSLQVEQTEESVPQIEEVLQDVEVVKEEITEVVKLPELEDTQKEEVALQFEDQPDEAVELTLHISDSGISEIEETRITEKSVNIEEEFRFQLPAVTDSSTEEVILEVKDQPSEEIVSMTIADQEIEVPESDAAVPVEQVSMETEEVFQLPVLQQEEDKEVVMDTEETPGEEIQFSIELKEDTSPFVVEEVTQRKMSRTEEITTEEVSTADDTITEEITLQIEDIPEEENEIIVQVGETETNLIEEITRTEEVIEEPQSFTFQLAEIDETTSEETPLQVEETPGEEVELTFQISDDQMMPQIQESQESETTTNTTEEITFQVSDLELGDTTTEEITFQLTEQPQEEIELTLEMPEHVKEITKIVVTEEEKITVPEATTTREIFADIEIPEGDLAPDFTWGLTSLKVMDGEEAKFRCEVEGHPMPEISWFHDDKPITENQDFKLTYNTGSGACTLLIVEVFPQDAGEYTCIAVNKYGKAITRGYLEVECE
ncbi:titin-like [Ylistrum balloti]|uniref:titin-like n=1 Tax=Ylistrum balloti TaxID=509963 RepID=UPI002905F5E6|nr:titin-like [Ylistrum balloti]